MCVENAFLTTRRLDQLSSVPVYDLFQFLICTSLRVWQASQHKNDHLAHLQRPLCCNRCVHICHELTTYLGFRFSVQFFYFALLAYRSFLQLCSQYLAIIMEFIQGHLNYYFVVNSYGNLYVLKDFKNVLFPYLFLRFLTVLKRKIVCLNT